MESEFTVTAGFETVYLINGAFAENPVFRFDPDEVLYITVLPLSAHLLPYTVKIVSGTVRSNRELAVCARLGGGYFVRFMPRYAYMYGAGRQAQADGGGSVPARFFALVKEGRLPEARALMTKELSSSVTDADLSAFFDGYTAAIENAGKVYLLDENSVGTEYRFALSASLIDNIEEIAGSPRGQ